MTCKDAMIKKPLITAKPKQTVGEAMEIFEKKRIRNVPVVDDSGNLLGLFTLRLLLKNLLPAAVTMEHGLSNLDFVVDSDPGAAKRLGKLQNKKLSEVMEKDVPLVYPETTAWEVVRLMERHGSPIAVVEPGSRKFIGLVSSQSMIQYLQHVMQDIEKKKSRT